MKNTPSRGKGKFIKNTNGKFTDYIAILSDVAMGMVEILVGQYKWRIPGKKIYYFQEVNMETL